MPPPTKVFFDGGCRPNPGTMETAVVVRGQVHIARDRGQGNSAEAEWLALIEAVRIAQSLVLADYVLLGDALDVISAARGTVRPSAAAADHLATFRALCGPRAPRLRHIRRAQNLAGIALARLHPR